MSRLMPVECEHGKIIDWGDFGAEDGSSPPEECLPCETLRLQTARSILGRYKRLTEWIITNG